MDSGGYRCVLTTLRHPRTDRPGVLWCDSGPRRVLPFVQGRWQATFGLTGNTVAGVDVSVGLIGP